MKAILNIIVAGLFYSGIIYADLADNSDQVLAPGYSPLQFKAPEVGSYKLPVIGSAADGVVLNITNQSAQLHDLMDGKIVLLSFIYSTCSDVNGCPLATAVLHKINRRLQQEPQIAAKLRLLTLSFNPEHDTPEIMRHYAEGFKNEIVDWQFLTTNSEQQLQPILDQYQQSIQKTYDEQGKFTGTFSHILRVYLIDTNKQLRNIYSVSFLHADTLINDVKTLLNQDSEKIIQQTIDNELLFQAGDNKQQYEQKDYKTQAIALTQRQGRAANLLDNILQPPLGLSAVPVPVNNQVNAEKIALGRKLFFDRRLSLNNTFSCAMCHIPEQGFSSNEMATAVGIEGRTVRRNSPTIYNVGYASLLFHDGRENTLEQQVWAPLLAHNEMGNPSIGYVIDKIKSLPDYSGLFEQSFNQEPNMITVGQAIASYERSLNSANSAFDRWYFGQQKNSMTASAQRGFQLFNGKAGCSSCHIIDSTFALFIDNQLHNTGIGYQESMQKTAEKHKIQIAPGVIIEVDNHHVASVSEAKANDLGRYEISQNPQDRWKYKTPSLRNINLTAPYMHNGSVSTLEQVVRFYNQGGVINENLDPLIKPLNLTETEINDLVEFLKSLTGSNIKQLVSDAYAAPIGDM
jgi:cytochrome c peroxidase